MQISRASFLWFFFVSALAGAGFFYSRTIFLKPPASFPFSQQAIDHSPAMVFPFAEPLSAQGWKEHSFHEKTRFEVQKDGGEAVVRDGGKELFVRASSSQSSSALYRGVNLHRSGNPHLSWEWKVTRFPSNKRNKVFASKGDNDFGARVYVVFGSRIPLTSEVIQYVWDDHFPVGTVSESPYSKKVKVLVIRSGPLKSKDEWMVEERDLRKDYERLFGRKLKQPVTAIGFTTDSDNTGTDSEAFFRRFAVKMPRA